MARIFGNVDTENSSGTGGQEEEITVLPQSAAGAKDGPREESSLRPQTASSTIDFFVTVGKLKRTKRRGWEIQKLQNTESVADHMYRMAVMILVAPPMPGLNLFKCVAMAVVHDIAEAHVGDITPHCGKSKEEEHALEDDAIAKMCTELGTGIGAELVRDLWNEYEAGVTLEAKFVKDVDKIEQLLQAAEYEAVHKKKMSEVFDQTEGKFQTAVGIEWADEVISRRPSLALRGCPPSMAGIVGNADTEMSSVTGGQEYDITVLPQSAAGANDRPREESSLRPQTASSTIDFFVTVGKLKTTKRRGWEIQKLQNTESVAEHMYRMAVMTLVAPPMPGVDRLKCVAMAVVHDIAEAHVGDITPHCGKTKEQKHVLEDDAIAKMCNELGAGIGAELVRELWDEYETGVTLDAKFLKDIDKIELLLQATEYEVARKKKMNEFFDQTEGKFQTPVGIEWADEAFSRRVCPPSM